MDNHQPEPTPTPATAPWHRGAVIFIVTLAIVGSATWWFISQNKSQVKNDHSSQEQEQENSLQQANKSWLSYRHDVLGISFNYPPTWGQPSTSPTDAITDLTTVGKGYDEDNTYFNNVELDFYNQDQSNHTPQIKFFNEQHQGERYPNSYAYPFGFMDNFPMLKQAQNVCQYKIEFIKPQYTEGEQREIYSGCKDKVKMAIIEHTQQFGGNTGTLYTYRLMLYGYLHLRNGQYDHVLISQLLFPTKQLKSRLTADQFFTQNNLDLSTNQEVRDFTAFVNGMTAYAPPKVEKAAFTSLPNEDPNVTLIRRHYYDLTPDPARKIYQAEPRDFRVIGTNDYEFWVDYQENNTRAVQQRVKAKVVAGKVEQYFLDTLHEPQVQFKDLSAYAAQRGQDQIILVRRPNAETVIDSGPDNAANEVTNIRFADLGFSPSGRYLTYREYGWEWGTVKVYDLQQQKIVLENSADTIGFNKDETYYYECGTAGMGWEQIASVYELPDFKLKLDLLQRFPDLITYSEWKCVQDDNQQVVHFNFKSKYTETEQNPEASISYDVNLTTGELIK